MLMREYILEELTNAELISLTRRMPDDMNDVLSAAREIINNVRVNGDQALLAYSRKFDDAQLDNIRVSEQELQQAAGSVSSEVKLALRDAAANIEKFHKLQHPAAVETETGPGVFCRLEWRPISRVGLYIPAGSAPLAS